MHELINLADKILSKAPKAIITILSTFLLILTAGIDFYFGPRVTLSLFYLIPVFISTWFINKTSGLIISIISAFIWFFIDFFWKHFFLSDNFIIYWDIIVRFIFFFIIVNILSFLKET